MLLSYNSVPGTSFIKELATNSTWILYLLSWVFWRSEIGESWLTFYFYIKPLEVSLIVLIFFH